MTPKAFKHWRKSLQLSQKEAAAALGLKHRIVQYYEKGERDGKPIQIPKSVRLACWAISQGVTDYNGDRGGAFLTRLLRFALWSGLLENRLAA